MVRVLIITKDIQVKKKLGGVGSYYKALRDKFSNEIEYFNYSFVKSNKSITKAISRLLNIKKFVKKCFSKNPTYQLIHLNPSLSWSSVIRDGFFLLIAKAANKKIIVFFRGWHEYMVRKIDNNRITRSLFKKTYNKADAMIVLSDNFRDKLCQWGFKQPIYIETTVVDDALIPNGNALSRTKEEAIKLLFLARIEKAKGIYELLDAYQLLKIKHINISLCIAGDGSHLGQLKQLASERNISDIYFTGYVAGKVKAKTFLKSDLYIFPTFHGEGMPNSVLEAMAFGLPIVSRPVGGLKDCFINGKMGYLTESKDPKVFAELIEKLIVNPELRKEISAFNVAFARKHFMASTVAKRLENIYKEVLEGKAKGGSWMTTTN